jgi:hypothetical protein
VKYNRLVRRPSMHHRTGCKKDMQLFPLADAMASSAYLRVEVEVATLSPTQSGGSLCPPRHPFTNAHRQQTLWLAGALVQADLPSYIADAVTWMNSEQAIVADFLRDDTTADLAEALKLTKTQLQRLRAKIHALGPAPPPRSWALSAPDMKPPPTKSAEGSKLLLLGQLSLDRNLCGNRNQAGYSRAVGQPPLNPKRHAARSPPPNRKKRRAEAKRDLVDISDHIACMGLYPESFGGLRREYDGSFSLESLMTYWGNSVGLSIGTILKALQEHLFKNIGCGKPKLRFSISQGLETSESLMIKVLHPAGL